MSQLRRVLTVGILLWCAGPRPAGAEVRSFDIVVYGATAGGVMAAVAAAGEGRTVALVEPGRHVGGMLTGGLGRTDMDRQEEVIGGLAREFFVRAGREYGQPIAWLLEGYVTVPVEPYEIPYRVLLPRQAEVANLLVTSCILASHVAYSSFRMEPQYMIAGHAAGVAAAQAVASQRDVHHIDIVALRERLREQGQILRFE